MYQSCPDSTPRPTVSTLHPHNSGLKLQQLEEYRLAKLDQLINITGPKNRLCAAGQLQSDRRENRGFQVAHAHFWCHNTYHWMDKSLEVPVLICIISPYRHITGRDERWVIYSRVLLEMQEDMSKYRHFPMYELAKLFFFAFSKQSH